MLQSRIVYILILSLVTSVTGRAQSRAGNYGFILLDAKALQDVNRNYHKGDAATVKQVNMLICQADTLLNAGPYSVTFDKTKLAPSNNKHDYVSQAPYWWVDSSKADGKPYIRRDGKRNPEIYLLHDASQMVKMSSAVKKLALAYYLTEKDAYAQKADQLLKTWFIDTATRMNPNLNYAQYVPGVNDGRGIGIIESVGLTQVPDAIALLQKSKISPTTIAGVKAWFAAYTDWLVNSKNGRQERKELNNHGTNYDLQVADFALFTGNRALAVRMINEFTIPRIAQQFTADGRQPLELARTRAWDYSQMNLYAWIRLAHIAEGLGIDLWHKQTADGKGIESALGFLLPYATKQKPWTYPEIGKFEYGNLRRMVHMAAGKYPKLDTKQFYNTFPDTTPLFYLN